MSNYYKSTLELVGNTCLVEVTNIENEQNLEASDLVKLEYFNPGGSVKDRNAEAMRNRNAKSFGFSHGRDFAGGCSVCLMVQGNEPCQGHLCLWRGFFVGKTGQTSPAPAMRIRRKRNEFIGTERLAR